MTGRRADFEVISFWEYLGPNDSGLNTSARFVGNQSSKKQFIIGEKPAGRGYISLQLYDVSSSNHSIKINDKYLDGNSIRQHPVSKAWLLWIDVIEEGVLVKGQNTLQIIRGQGDDSFVVDQVIVHWREIEE